MFVDVSEGFVGDIGAELRDNKILLNILETKFSKEKENFTPDDMMKYLKKTNLKLHIKTMLSLIPEGKEAEFKEAICSAAERRKVPPVNYRKMLEIAQKGGFAEEFERVHALDKVINDKPRKTKTLFVKSTEELENTPNLSEYTTIVCDFEDKKELMPMVIPGNNVFIAYSNDDLEENPDLTKYDAVICDFEGVTEFADLSKLCKRMIIKGDIFWNRENFEKLPDISESIVCGDFSVSSCYNLKSLVGAPKVIGNDFECVDCRNVESLDGLKCVGGMARNGIIGIPDYCLVKQGKVYDLFNLPEDEKFVILGNLDLAHLYMDELPDLSNVIVNGDFYCSGNYISDLKGSPKEVHGDVVCRNCNNLTSLEGAPEYVGGRLYCSGCSELEGGDIFLCIDGQYYDLFNLPKDREFVINGDLNLSNMKLKELPDLSNVIVKGDFRCNYISDLKGFPKEIGGVFCCYKGIYSSKRDIYLVQDGRCYDLFNLPKDREFVINGDLNLIDMDLEKLPDLSNVIVKGKFDCSYNNISDLKGAPKEVGGNFDCCGCKNLESLRGAPEKVGGSVYCNWNDNLTSLEGAPKEVGKNFYCCGCKNLESLRGAPEKVGESFYCWGNNNLISLQGAPKEIGRYFDCDGCIHLKSAEGLPMHIGGGIVCSDKFRLVIKKELKRREKLAKQPVIMPQTFGNDGR